MKHSLLKGKKILVVDDEPDVLETLTSLLDMCHVEKASNFNKASRLLEEGPFDLAILDIMGVDGYKLLEIANKKEIMAVMLTAHALSPSDTVKSFKEGAAFFIPKDEMANIANYLNDILETEEKGLSFVRRWLERLSWYYDNRFGPDWKDSDRKFWKNIQHKDL